MNGLLLKGELFSLLSELSQVTNEEMQSAYDNFLDWVEKLNQSENYSVVFRILNHTRIEFASLEMLYQYGQGEKCA